MNAKKQQRVQRAVDRLLANAREQTEHEQAYNYLAARPDAEPHQRERWRATAQMHRDTAARIQNEAHRIALRTYGD